MLISLRSIRGVAAGAVGAGALTGAMLFSAIPAAQAAPAPAPATSFATVGSHDVIPTRGGWGGDGHGGDHDGGWGDHDGGRGGDHGGDWDRGGWGHGGDWDRGGWGHGGDWDRGGWR
jgi:hypothetical protein